MLTRPVREGLGRCRLTGGIFSHGARDTASPYIDNPDASGLVATEPELREGLASRLREYKAVYVQSDAEIGLFSDEVVVNCAP